MNYLIPVIFTLGLLCLSELLADEIMKTKTLFQWVKLFLIFCFTICSLYLYAMYYSNTKESKFILLDKPVYIKQ